MLRRYFALFTLAGSILSAPSMHASEPSTSLMSLRSALLTHAPLPQDVNDIVAEYCKNTHYTASKPLICPNGPDHGIKALAMNPLNSNMLASGHENGTIRLWDLQTNPKSASFITALAFKLWDDLQRTKPLYLMGHTSFITALTFSPDGKTLASGSHDRTIRLWNIATGKTTNILSDHRGLITSLTFSPDGKTLASGSMDRTIRLWDLKNATSRVLPPTTGVTSSLAFSHDGATLASTTYSSIHMYSVIRLWNLAKNNFKELGCGNTPIRAIAFSADDTTLTSVDFNSVKIWDLATNQPPITIPCIDNSTAHKALSSNGKMLAILRNNNNSIQILIPSTQEATTKKSIQDLPHNKIIESIRFCPNNERLLVTTNDNRIYILNEVADTIAQEALKQYRSQQHIREEQAKKIEQVEREEKQAERERLRPLAQKHLRNKILACGSSALAAGYVFYKWFTRS